MNYGCDMDILPNCCGMYEAGQFKERTGKCYSGRVAESPEELLVKCINKAEGRPIIFNFVKEALYKEDEWGNENEPTGEFEAEYEANAFRQVVKAHKNVIDIGTHVNPGTNNKIHTYILIHYNE